MYITNPSYKLKQSFIHSSDAIACLIWVLLINIIIIG